jgi:hypothetical protein
VAGFINVVSGGGGFLSIGALLISGLPRLMRTFNNKIQALGSSLTLGNLLLRRGHINVQEHKYVFLSPLSVLRWARRLSSLLNRTCWKKLCDPDYHSRYLLYFCA